jgi:hypothetical protein
MGLPLVQIAAGEQPRRMSVLEGVEGMTRAAFRQSDVTRAIRAAKAAGLANVRCEIAPDGRIVLSESETPPDDPYTAWKRKREAAPKGPAQG